MANSVDPDQTAPIGAVCSGSTLFASILYRQLVCSRRLQQTTFSDTFFLGALRVNIIGYYIHSCSYLDAERISLWYNILQLSNDAYVHLINLNSSYVTLVLLGLEDDPTRLSLGGQSQRFKNLCMSGLHKIWSSE